MIETRNGSDQKQRQVGHTCPTFARNCPAASGRYARPTGCKTSLEEMASVSTRTISIRKVVVSAGVFVVGMISGFLNGLDNGTWAIFLTKDNNVLVVLFGDIIRILSASGNASEHVLSRILELTGVIETNKYPYWHPLLFWVGQLAFYSFVSISILRLRSRTK